MSYRFIAQLIDGEIVHWELPLSEPSIKFVLSGPCVISGKITPETPDLVDLGLTDWGAWVHVEEDGVIRASGLITPSSVDGETLTIECEGASTYPHGIPYLGKYSVLDTDAADIVREIWRHVQSYQDGDIGVTVTGTTGVKLGKKKTDANPELGPYELAWWNETDCGDEVTKLATECPFDFIERDQWNTNRTGVDHFIDIAPRIGRRRDDLRFVLGENIVEEPSTAQNEEYASHVIGAGAGEGSKKVHAHAQTINPRKLRRCHVLSDSTVTTKARMQQLAQAELGRRAYPIQFSQITVDARHDNALVGSWRCGDDVLVQSQVAYVGWVKLWHRVTGWEYTPDSDRAVLDLKRVDPL